MRRVLLLLLLLPVSTYGAEDLDAILRSLGSGDAEERHRAVEEIGRLGPAAAAAVPELARVADDDEDLDVRREACLALGAVGPAAHSAVPALLRCLADEIIQAEEALGRIGKAALPALVGALDSPNYHVRDGAAGALADIGPDAEPAVPALGRLLSDGHWDVRVAAARALGAIGPAAAPTVPALLEALPRAIGVEVHWILRALGRIGPGAEGAVPHLLALLATAGESVRIAVYDALGGIRPEARVALGILAASDPSRRVRQSGLTALMELGRDAWPAVPALTRLLGDTDLGSEAAWALVQVGEMAVPALLTALSEEDPRIRVRAVAALAGMRRAGAFSFALASIGEPVPPPPGESLFRENEVPAPVLQAVVGALDDVHPRVQEASARALSEIRLVAPEAIDRLVKRLEDEDRGVLAAVALALGRTRSRPREVVPALGRRLSDDDPLVRERVLDALSRYGRWGAPLAPAVIAALDDPEMRVRGTAIRAAESLGPAAAAAVPRLVSLLGDEWLGTVAANALAAIGPSSLSALEESLGSPDATVRENTEVALMRMGPLAALRGGSEKRRRRAAVALAQLGRAAVPGLVKLLGEASPENCEFALFVLEEIGPDAAPSLPAVRKLVAHEVERIRTAAARAASFISGE